MSRTLKAAALVAELGAGLVGRRVETQPFGVYPGGWATVTQIAPDDAAPEIAFLVQHPTWREGVGGGCEDGIIGVFEFELVTVEEVEEHAGQEA